jgi:hypothetical protein
MDSEHIDAPISLDTLPREAFDTRRWLTAFLILGIAVRLSRYLLRFPLWGDEMSLAANLIHTSFLGITRPLQFKQAAPIPFLWMEHLNVLAFGFNEYSLRLVAILSGIISMVLFTRVARRILAGPALVFAVGVFAVSYFPIRSSAETKPYGSDLLVSLALVALAVEWHRQPSQTRWLWILAVATPLALAMSFPAIFTMGAISCSFVFPVWRRRDRGAVAAFLGFNVAIAISFILLQHFVLKAQYAGVHDAMENGWSATFPPVTHPLALIRWLLDAFTGEMLAYPIGGRHGGGTHAFLALAIGLIVFWRKNRPWFVTMTLAMFLLGFLAAAARRYPITGHPRFTQYLVPAICLAMGAGIAQAIAWLGQPEWQRRTLRGAVYVLFAIGVGCFAQDIMQPYKGPAEEIDRGFARWFWSEHPEMQDVCVFVEMHRQLYDGVVNPSYLCYRAMYERRSKLTGTDAHAIRASTAKPVRCVVFHMLDTTRQEDIFTAWMADMNSEYDLTGHATYRVPIHYGKPDEIGFYEAYYFTPRSPSN